MSVEALANLMRWLLGSTSAPLPDHVVAELDDDLVRQHRLAGLCYRRGIERYRIDFVRNALSAEIWREALDEVLDRFARKGIDVCRLKGCAYVDRLYEDPGERPMGDLDLLVRKGQFDRALDELQALGYVLRQGKRRMLAPTHHAVTLDRQRLSVDLHRSMMQSGRARLDLEGIWRRADLDAQRLAPKDELLLHICHMVRHEFMVPMSAYVDLNRLLERSPTSRRDLLDACDAARVGKGARKLLESFDALRLGRSQSRRARFPLPSTTQLLTEHRLPRSQQILAKAYLLEGARELGALAAVTLFERLLPWKPRTTPPPVS